MSLKALHHCSIRNEKEKMDATKDFYVDILGMKVGERPPFDFPGYWLYVGEQAVIHIVGIDPNDPQGLLDYLGEDRIESLEGGGAVDHLAFHSDEPDELVDRLEEREYPFFQRKVPEMDLHQIFVKDPNDITIELNYFGDGATRHKNERLVGKVIKEDTQRNNRLVPKIGARQNFEQGNFNLKEG